MNTHRSLLLLMVLAVNTASGQIVPPQPPADTAVGGSGASEAALVRTGLERQTIGAMDGPASGRGRSRHEVQTFQISDAQVPGVEDYFLRSSYVVLEPGGLAPLHSHARRPAFLQVISGEVSQHRSDGLSLLMGPGDFTFSSDSVVHWWVNESKSDSMRLWIVELCTEKHGCDKVVEEGAERVPSLATAEDASPANAVTVMDIDLAGEFPDEASGLGDSELRLRRIEIAPGEEFKSVENPTVLFARVHSGALKAATDSGSRTYSAGSVMFSEGPGTVRWSSDGKEPAVIYAVDITQATRK